MNLKIHTTCKKRIIIENGNIKQNFIEMLWNSEKEEKSLSNYKINLKISKLNSLASTLKTRFFYQFPEKKN